MLGVFRQEMIKKIGKWLYWKPYFLLIQCKMNQMKFGHLAMA